MIMVCSAFCYAVFLFLFPGTLQRIGASLTPAAYLYCAYQFRKKGLVNMEAAEVTCAAYRAELQRVRDFSFISSLMAPFVPGPALFVMGFLIPEMGVLKAVGLTTALIAPPFALAIPLVQRRRRVLGGEIRSVDALMR